MIKKEKLIVLTGGFPFGNGETFLETEIKYLCDSFVEVHILSVNPKDEIKRKVPENCKVSVIRFERGFIQKLKSLVGFFDKQVYKELQTIKKEYGLRLNKGIISTLLFSLQNAKTIKNQISQNTEIDKDTIIYSYWCDDRALAIALLSMELGGIKAITRIHGWDVYFNRSQNKYLPFRQLIVQKLTRIFSISQDGIDYAVNYWKVDRSKFVLSRLGINNEYGPVISKNDGIFRIVSCSNLIPLKRINLIADALNEIDGVTIEWTHIGDGPMKIELDEKVKLLPSNISVNLVGRLSNKDVYKLYESICPDLFINVSSSEGVPVSIMEAMSYGIPVMATDVGGNSEIVNEKNGFPLSSNCEKQELVDKLNFVFRTSKLGSLRKGAFNTWKEDYSGKVNYEKFTDMLLKL